MSRHNRIAPYLAPTPQQLFSELVDKAFVSPDSFDQSLKNIVNNSLKLSLDQENDGGLIIIHLLQNPDLIEKFIKKLDIESDSPKEKHANCLHGAINNVSNSKGSSSVKILLAAGFDPGIEESAGKDMLQVTLERFISKEYDGRVVFEPYQNQNDYDSHLNLISITQSVLRTGKIAGFEGVLGINEAAIIGDILETGRFPDTYSQSYNVTPNNHVGLTATNPENSIPYDIHQDGYGDKHANKVRAYLKQFHNRPIPQRSAEFMSDPVPLWQLEGQSSPPIEQSPNSSIFANLCGALLDCFGKQR